MERLDLIWQVTEKSWNNGGLEYSKKKVVGEPCEGKPHARFDVAGDENQNKAWRLPLLIFQASSLDPTSGRFASGRVKNYRYVACAANAKVRRHLAQRRKLENWRLFHKRYWFASL